MSVSPFTPVLIQMSTLTAGFVIYSGLEIQVVRQIRYMRRKNRDTTLFFIMLNALFWGNIAFMSNLVSLTFYPDDCKHHIVAATSHGICVWSINAFLVIKSASILKNLVDERLRKAFLALCTGIWVCIVVTFIIYNIATVQYVVVPNVVCLPFFDSKLAVVRSLEIVLCFITTASFAYTVHVNTRGMKGSAGAEKIQRLKVKSVASAVVCCMFIVVAAILLTTEGQKPEWGPYNITIIVIEMIAVGLSLVYSNQCEMASESTTAASSLNGKNASNNRPSNAVSKTASATGRESVGAADRV